MDIILSVADELFLDCLYARYFPASPAAPPDAPLGGAASLRQDRDAHNGTAAAAAATIVRCLSCLPRDDLRRQAVSIFALVLVGVTPMYFLVATLSYYFLFDHQLMHHPKFLKNQIKLEIISSLKAFAPIDALSLPWFLAEVRGHSRLYENVSDIRGVPLSRLLGALAAGFRPVAPAGAVARLERLAAADIRFGGGWTYLCVSYVLFLAFTDFAIYLVHKLEHHPLVYKHIHKAHHRWIIPSPFASYAFHPVDGYLQSVPYHIFVFVFPFHRTLYLVSFVLVTLWTIFIHDSDLIVGGWLENYINGPTHHTLHHLYFTCNYGQYFTWADQFFGSYRHPTLLDRPLGGETGKLRKIEESGNEKEELRKNKRPIVSSETCERRLRRLVKTPQHHLKNKTSEPSHTHACVC